ncbi:hypothetical protein GIB67_027422 [Kingdonia uniflora]|uniref:Alpha 1,4-glycosyltransferase domain-containing protein n=1 Tax=Kingdonia uniflora TaxID=39325 RepID=A0A7J7MF71_9MAGN|nr:hypothetical protein GIB67_027422 [Kingdonia uniflora]
MLSPQRTSGHMAKFPTLSFAATLFIFLLAFSIFCNISLHIFALRVKKPSLIIPPEKIRKLFPSNSLLSVESVQEEVQESYVKDMEPKSLLPPINVTEEERILWFRRKLPKIEIFKSSELTVRFAVRAETFFGEGGCEERFFMTWISPTSSFHQREFFALESLFKAHPDGCLIILSRTMDSRRGKEILTPLTERGFNVIALAPNIPFLLKNTPAEPWFKEIKTGNKDPGEIPLAQNLSNLLRLAALYKYGGIYLDTDFIVLKKLSGLKNTIGAQSMTLDNKNWTRLNNAVLIFDKNHPILFKFIEEFSLTFDGNKWGHNGPYLVSRVVDRVWSRPGYNITVLPPMAFYPADWNRITGFFRKPVDLADSRWAEAKLLQLSGDTYGVHLWNKQSSKLEIEEGSIMGRLISNHCVVCEHIYASTSTSSMR